MLYTEKLAKFHSEIKPIVDEAFQKAYTNQVDKGDLLLLISHAHMIEIETGSPEPAPGPTFASHAHASQMKLISEYRKVHFPNKEVYFQTLATNPDKIISEEISIHLELLVYQKLWEMQIFQEQLYQLGLLLNGLRYDWSAPPSDTRFNMNNIRGKFKRTIPSLYVLIKEIFDERLRNSIAHSDFFVDGNSCEIFFLDDGKIIKQMDFEEWNTIFTKSLLLQSLISAGLNHYSGVYDLESKSTGDKYIITTRIANDGQTKYSRLSLDPLTNRWIGYENLIASGRTL